MDGYTASVLRTLTGAQVGIGKTKRFHEDEARADDRRPFDYRRNGKRIHVDEHPTHYVRGSAPTWIVLFRKEDYPRGKRNPWQPRDRIKMTMSPNGFEGI